MENSIRRTILFLLVVSSFAYGLPNARGGCGGGPCSLGAGSSYDFLGDPAVNIDMPSPDDFVRANIGKQQTMLSNQTMLSSKSPSGKLPENNSSSINQTKTGNSSQNSSAAFCVIDGHGSNISCNAMPSNLTQDSRIVRLGAAWIKEG
jgi:hypothetical protein